MPWNIFWTKSPIVLDVQAYERERVALSNGVLGLFPGLVVGARQALEKVQFSKKSRFHGSAQELVERRGTSGVLGGTPPDQPQSIGSEKRKKKFQPVTFEFLLAAATRRKPGSWEVAPRNIVVKVSMEVGSVSNLKIGFSCLECISNLFRARWGPNKLCQSTQLGTGPKSIGGHQDRREVEGRTPLLCRACRQRDGVCGVSSLCLEQGLALAATRHTQVLPSYTGSLLVLSLYHHTLE